MAIVTLRQQLHDLLGYASVFDVVRLGRQQAAARLTQATTGALDTEQANAFFDQIQARAASLTRLYSQLGARGEPVIRALGKLEVAYDATWMARALGTGANYEDWFKPPEDTLYYAHPDSVGSLFSPASYLTTLYRAARPLHLGTHGLQLDKRRPDLRALKLTDTHLNQELSTLALTLEVLEAGVNDSDSSKDVDTKLREAIYPMTLPYNHAVEQIRRGLGVKKTSAAEVWAALGDYEGVALKRVTDLSAWGTKLNVPFVQDVLGINPELYTILTESYDNSPSRVGAYYGLNSIHDLKYTSELREAVRLPAEQILEALGTGPYFGFRVLGLVSVVPNSVAINAPSTVLRATPPQISFPSQFNPTPDGFVGLELTISWLSVTEISPGGTLRLKARLDLWAFKADSPIGEIQDEFTVSLFRQYGRIHDEAQAVSARVRPHDADARAKEVDYDLGITAQQLLPGKTYNAELRWNGRYFPVVGQVHVYHDRPDPYELEALANGLVVEKSSDSNALVLRFQSTVKVDGAETHDYAWSLDIQGLPATATPTQGERTQVGAQPWELPLGHALETLPPDGLTLQLRLVWQGGQRTETRNVSFYPDISSDSSLLSPQTYGARYINGWATSPEHINTWIPHYWYIGPQVGHPASPPANDPANSGLYKRSIQARDRLNRVIRLKQKLPLSFEELDWLIASTIPNIADYPLIRPMQALAVYLPLRERFGLSVDAFVACVGPINTFHRPDVTSLFEQRFGDPANVLGQTLDLQVPVETDPVRAAARAALCQGLRIDDSTLRQLAVYLDGVSENDRDVVITLDRVAALYRLVEIPRLWGLSVSEGLALWELLGEPEAIAKALGKPRPTLEALDTIMRTGYLVDWLHGEELEPLSLLLMTTRRYARVATPELQRFIENILSTLGSQSDTEEEMLTDLLCRHIGAELALKANVATVMIRWLDAVAGQMNAELISYTVLSFWQDVQAWSRGAAHTLEGLERTQVRVIQYVHLLGQFALVCQWAQLTEQDLALVLPQQGKTSPLTGETRAPTLTLELLVLLSRYRRWQRQLVGPVNEARRYLELTAAGELTDSKVAIEQLAALHGWDVQQTEQGLGAAAIPKSFVALQPLVRRMQWAARLGLAPPELMMLEVLSNQPTSQSDLELIAAKVIAAAHV